MRVFFATVAAICSIAAILPPSAEATTLQKLSLDEMITKSTAVVRGKIRESQAAYRGSIIYTHYSVQVLDWLKGSGAGSVDVVVPGGAVGNLRQTVSGAPELVDGTQYVLFLWTSPSGLNQVLGLSQGLLDVTVDANGAATVSRAPLEGTVVNASGRPVKDETVHMRLQDLASRIRSAATR